MTTATRPTYGDLVQQYLALRDQHPGALLLFRVGSFYEVLFEDAELVARELGLKLGDRPSGGSAPPVPQCGFAHHALDSFLPRLLEHGYRVAVCEESEQEGSGIRQRAVVRTLTAGTVVDPRLLRDDRPTYLAAVVGGDDDRLGLAWTDLAVGEFRVGEFSLVEAVAELQRLDPAEVVVPADRTPPEALTRRRGLARVDAVGALAALEHSFPDASGALAGLPLAGAAGGLIVRYLQQTRGQERNRAQPSTPSIVSADDAMRLDAPTQRHLELVETERGRDPAGSLLSVVDRAVTPMGRRMLRGWLLRPLTARGKIELRQRIVAELIADQPLREGLARVLLAIADLERLAERARRHRAGADDLRALASAARAAAELGPIVASANAPFLRALGKERRLMTYYARDAERLLPPAGDGGVRSDASPALVEAHRRAGEAATWQARHLAELRRLPGLERVRIERTSTQGIFLEVPANTRVPAEWMRRGGLQKVERYSTAALEEHAVELAEAEALLAHCERVAVDELRAKAASVAVEARDLARNLAAADALLSLATVALDRGWIAPTVDEGGTVEIVGGRHPVLEALGPFQANDARLVAGGEANQLIVLTGPNMAGKSTWMRQIALIVLLAQVGSYVPAASARVGLVDAIYTRIGAVDDLAGGRSTFMVEMSETAAVLAGATDRSLIVLDEIGRGTSTHDGMAIAWAIVEHLAGGPTRPRAIVATHYHELAALQTGLPQVSLRRAAVDEGEAGVSFPHRIEPGAADRSFGIEVARLAGLPEPVLARARQVADAVEPLTGQIATRLAGRPKVRRLEAAS